MDELLTSTAIVAVIAGGIRLSVPLLLAGLGEMFSQRSGVLNLGVDGVMLLGAFGGYYVTLQTRNVWLGLAVGLGVGIVFGLLTAIISVTLQAEQGISGIGIYLLGLGVSDLLFQKLVGTPVPIPSFPRLAIPGLSDAPIIGPMLFEHSIVVYVAFALVPLALFGLNRTTFGLNVRAVGETPEAADSLGVSVARVRYLTVTMGGAMAGTAGAVLSIELSIFQQNLTNAQGFIAIALVYFGAWRPVGVMAGALLFGVLNALVLQMKTLGIIPLSASNLAAMAPAIITVLALVVVANRFRAPTALTKPFVRGT